MKRFFFIALLAFSALTLSAQPRWHANPHHGQYSQPVRHHRNGATREQMQMVLKVLDEQSFDDKKLDIACLCVCLGHFCCDDLAVMAQKFSFDDNRKKFLTYAFYYCTDPQHYYRLRETFTFQSNFDDMMRELDRR